MSLQDYIRDMNERLGLVVLWAVLFVCWLFDAVNIFSFFLIGGLVTFFLLQFEYRVRLLALRYGRRKARAKKNKIRKGVMSMRAQALNTIPTPILIISENQTISFANRAAEKVIGNKLIDEDVFFYLRQPEMVEAITQAIDGSLKKKENIRYTTVDDRSFDVTIHHLDSQAGIRNGRAIIFFYEVTNLLKIEKMRVDFVANASHELRTPLSSVMGFIETLQGPAKGDPQAQDRFLMIMQRESERMYRLIEDLLSLSRIEMDRHSAPSERVKLPALLKNVTHTLQPQAEQRNITFSLAVDDDVNFVIGDTDQLLQVLINLASNATKYANEDSVVTLAAEVDAADDDFVTLRVADQGPGIAPEHLARLTERFYRVDTARSRQMGGTGLGLAIVKHILLRHDSELTIESKLGKGTCFSFQLRRA